MLRSITSLTARHIISLVFTASKIKLFLDITPCGLVNNFRPSEGL